MTADFPEEKRRC